MSGDFYNKKSQFGGLNLVLKKFLFSIIVLELDNKILKINCPIT